MEDFEDGLMNEPVLASEEEIGLNIARKSADGMSEAEQRANASRLSGLTLGKIGSKDEEQVVDVEKMAQLGEGSLDDVTMGAAANEIQKAFTGTDDPLGRIWTKDHKGFKDGAEYLRLMKDVFVNGPQAAMTPEMREYMKATLEEQTKMAWEGLGKLKQSMEIGGALVSRAASFLFPRAAGANAPLDEREEKVAPKDIQEASYIVSEDRRMLGKTSFSPELVEEAREKLVKWRSERDDERMRAMHLQKLAKDNAWSQVPAVLSSLKGDARALAQELIDNPDKKPEEYASRLEALTTDEIEAVGQVRRLVKPVNESGFWNTIGDAALQFTNVATDTVKAPFQRGVRLGNKIVEFFADDPEAWRNYVNETAKKRQALQNAGAGYFITYGGATGLLPEMQFEQICEDHGWVADAVIGAISTLPYMGAAMLPKIGGVLVASQALEEFDRQVAYAGGDITDGRYMASSAILSGLYAYVERLQVEKIVGGVSEIKLKQAMMKGWLNALKNEKRTLGRYVVSTTLSESIQEGIQNGVQEVNKALALDGEVGSAFAEGFVEDFVGSLGTMFLVGAGGLVIGHAHRSGWKGGSEGRESREVDLLETARGTFALEEMVRSNAVGMQAIERMRDQLILDFQKDWNKGGREALEKLGLDEDTAKALDEYYSSLREMEGSDAKKASDEAEKEWNVGRGVESAPKDGEKGSIGEGYLQELSGRFAKGRMDAETFKSRLVSLGFTEKGAQDYQRLIELKREEDAKKLNLLLWISDRYEKAHADGGMTPSDKENVKIVKEAIRDLDSLRSVWSRGMGIYRKEKDGTVEDPGAKALESVGFSTEVASKLSQMFHFERSVASSRVALDGVRAMYEKATRGKVSGKAALASEFGGRVVRLETGTDAKGKTAYGDFISFKLPGGRGEAYVQIVESPTGAPDFTKNDKNVADSIEEEAKRKGIPVTAQEWLDATPEERERIWNQYRFYDEGYFAPDTKVDLVLNGDPAAHVDSDQAKRIVFGTITLASGTDIETLDSGRIMDSSVGFHEVYHAWVYFMEATGQWTEKEDAALAEKYGKGTDGKHNQEPAANAMRGYMNRRVEGRMTEEGETSPFGKIYALALRLIRRGKEKKVKERIAANAEEAFLDQIIADRFSGVVDLNDSKRTTASEESVETNVVKPTTAAAAPQLPGRKESSETETKGASTETKPAEVETQPVKTEKKPAATRAGAATKGWSAATPTGNVRVTGHWAVFKLEDLIHSNNPIYAKYMRNQLRNRKDNKAEEDAREKIIENFDPARLFEAPDTANGAPIVFLDEDENGVVRPFVLSGNGRVLVLNAMSERHIFDQYRNYMRSWAEENGLEVPDGDFVVVRVVDDYGGATREQVADLSNTNSIQQYTEEEQARADAEVIKALDIAKLYHANANGTADMTPGVNDDFFSQFIQGVGDTSLYNSDRSLTETARTRAVRALLAIAVGQGDRGRDVVKKLIEQTDTLNIARQKNAASIMAAAVAALESKTEYAIGPDVSRAMADFIDFAEKKKAGKIGTFEDYFDQMDLLDAPSNVAKEILGLFGSKMSAADIAEYVTVYCNAAAQEDPTGGLFGAEGARKRDDIWNDAKKLVDERRSTDGVKHSITSLEDPGIAKPYDLITTEEMDLIANEIGTTEDPLNIGFILPDGRMVRYLSHVACVSPVIAKRGLRFNDTTGYRMVGTALKSGMVRTGGLSRAWIQLGAKPTERQRDAIRDYIEAQRKESNYSDLTVEVEGRDNVFHCANYSLKVSPSKVFDEIDDFYDNGVEPKGQSKLATFFRWSIASADFSAVSRYYDGDVRDIVRGIKTKDDTSIALAAGIMARDVQSGAVLVPVPGHFGRADDTYALANAIARITGSPVVEALRGAPRQSIYDQKIEGRLPSADELGFYKFAETPTDRQVIFIDNVVGTGTTAVAAKEALGMGRVLSFAWDHTAPRPVGIVGGITGRHSFSSGLLDSDAADRKATIDAAVDFALHGNPVAILTGAEFEQNGKHDLVDRVAAYYKQIGGSVENEELGTVLIDRDSVKSSLGHGIGRAKAAAFAAVPEVIRKGFIFDRQINWKGRGVNSCVICAPIKIGEDAYVCEAIVQQKTDGKERRFYLHEVNLQSELSDTIKTLTGGASIGKQARPLRSILAKLAVESQRDIPDLNSTEYHSISSDALDDFAKSKGITTKKRRAALKKSVDGFAKFAKEYRSLYRDAVRYGDWKPTLDFAEQHGMPFASNVLKQYFEDPKFETKELVGLKINGSEDVAAILMTVRSPFVESFKAIYLDADKKILDAKILTIGQPSETAIGKGAVTREIPEGTAFVVVSHNHPSGHPKPSRQDVNLTQYVQAELDQSGVKLLDHIITDGGRYYSFNEKSEYWIDTTTPKWEMYPAGERGIPSFTSQEQVQNYIAAHLRDDGESGHIIYLNAQNDIVGVRRIASGRQIFQGENALDEWLDKAVEAVSKTGAVGVLVDLGPSDFEYNIGKAFARSISKKFDMFNVHVLDVIAGSENMESWMEYSGRDIQNKPTAQEFPKYSFAAGEIGSANMKNALFQASHLDKARQMLGKRDWAKIPHKERLAIKMATGWEKGADGKWRYEIMDLPKFDLSKVLMKNHEYEGISLSESKGNVEKSAKYKPFKIGDIWPKGRQKKIDLFDAYPWLNSITIVPGVKFSRDTVRGSFDDETMTVYLSEGIIENAEKIREVLTHEIQHVIQKIESFARGGNRSVARHLFLKKYHEAEKSAKDLYNEQMRLTSELIDNFGPMSRWYFYNWPKKSEEHQRVLAKLRESDAWLDFERRAAEFKRKNGHQFSYFTEGAWQANVMAMRQEYKDYTKLAGEVEARNAASRKYSPYTLLEDTEDTERRYQKLVDGNMEEFQSLTEAQEESERHSFAGLRGQNVAGIKSIDDAEVLERRGEDRETIFRLTGWYRGTDGLWRVELPFHGRFVFEGDFDGGSRKGYRTVSDYFDWTELFQAYPELKDVEVRFEDLPEDVRGDFDPKTKTIRIANDVRKGGSGKLARLRVAPVMVHEIQHAIQSIENHARGGDPDKLLTWDHTKVHDEIRRLSLARDLAETQDEKDELDEMIQEHEINLEADIEEATERYYRLAGEVEARNAADRFFKSPSWRLEHPPWETEDEVRENQIVSFDEEDDVHWDNVERGPHHSFAARLETVRQDVKAEGGDIYLAYHGTKQGGFKIFDNTKNDYAQPGFYFAKSRDTAMTYSSPTKYDMYDDDGAVDPLSMVEANALYNEYGIYNVALKMMKPLVVDCGGESWRRVPNPFDPNGGVETTREVTRKALESGKFDGVIFRNVVDYGPGYIPTPATDVYVVKDPEQIKVVDAVTYDDEGNIIPDDERLDWESPDIRRSIASAWGDKFPNVAFVTTRKYVKANADLDRLHHEAKSGSLRSALEFVDRLMPDEPKRPNEKERIRKIKQLAADYPNAWIVPVRAVEATGDNMLPFAYAQRIHQITGLPVSDSIKQSAKAGHTGVTAEERFFSRARFDGHVKLGREYILVDDHVTMGGTLAAMRKHIVNRGGKVVAATTLTVSKFSDKLSPRDGTLQKLIDKFGEDFPTLLKKAGVADELAELSEYEAAYLLKFSPDRLRALMARASDDLSKQTARRHGPGYAGRVRARSAEAGRLGDVPQVDGGVRGSSERGDTISSGSVRRQGPRRSGTSDVIPGLDEYVDPATGKFGETRYASAPLFSGFISKDLNAVIDESDQASETGEAALDKLISLIERAKKTPEGKIVVARYREGNSYNGTEAERNDPKRKTIWDAIVKELLDAPITANNNEGLELDKKNGKPVNADTIEESNAAYPELPAISNDENANYMPTCGRRLDIVIGPPAAGKSSVFVNKLSIFHRSRVLDSDAIKKRLPGFDKGNGASYVHEESSALNKLIIGMLLDRNHGENVVLPIVGANAKKVLDYIEKFRDAGYSIYLHNNYVPILHAFGRSLRRTMRSGRWISPDVFTGCMDAPSAVFEEIKSKADFWDEFDNDGPRYADPLYVRGNYVDPAYGMILKKNESRPIFGKNGVWTNRMLDPQMMLDFANAMDADEGMTPIFPPQLKQQRFDFGTDPEGLAKHAIRSDFRENGDKSANEALTNWITYFRLSHGSVPMAKTIARMGLAMGMSVVDSRRILQASETRAEQMRGSLIDKAAQNGDVATAMALLRREDGIDESIGKLLAGGVAKGGELTHRGVGQINTIIGKRVDQMMRDFTAATLADMEGETGLDIAAEILEQNPDAFADEIKGAKGTDPNAVADQNAEQPSDTDAPGGDGGTVDESQLTDLERYNRERARQEALRKVEEFIAKAKAKAEENRAKAEERRRRAEENGEGSGSGEGMGGGDPGVEDLEQAISNAMGGTNPKNVKANFKTKEEFAAFMRVWAEYKFDKTHGLSTLGKTERDKLFAEFYRITVRQELQDLADKLLAPKDESGVTISRIAKLGNGARNAVSRQIARIEKGLRPDTIERMSADIFGFINSAAIRVSRTDLVSEFKKELKDKYIKGKKYEDLKLDSGRRVTGWVEEAARYICRVCDLSKRSINGDITQLAAERKELLDIINRRADVYDESGKEVARAAVEDMETKKAMWKLALLDKYGAMTSLIPGEILDLRNAAFEYLENQAEDLERLWRDTRAYEEGIRKDLTAAIVAPNGQRYQNKGLFNGRLFDALNGLIRLRLQHLTRFAEEAAQKQAKDAINKIIVLLGDGETAYNRMLQEDRQALFDGLAKIFSRNGRADNAAIKKYLNRMTEPIPVELAQQISNQGFVGTMTYGQMLQLLVSLEQRSFKEAIEHNGRQGQSELIRTFTTTDKDGRRVNVFTAEDNMFIEWLRAFYEAKRDVISPVTMRMVGQQVDSPDPLYCPIKRSMEDRVQALAEAGSTWDPIASVFTRRVKNNRDFDEQASILGMFFDRSNETAKLVAWAERGTIIRGVFTNVGVQSAIRRAFGSGELRKIMTQLLATFNGGVSKKQTPGELAAVDKALNFTTYAYLGFNPLSSLKQTTSFTVWANALPGGFKDLWKYMTHFDAKVIKHLKESDEYRVRYGNEVGSGQDMATKGINENPSMNPVLRMLSGAGMWMLKKADFAPGGWIAQGVYKDMLDKHMQEGMSFDEADRLAITETFNLLEETQQSGRTYNTNMLTLDHGRIGRLLTQFATSPLQQLQYETQAWREWRDMVRYGQGEKKIAAARQKLVRAAVINHLLLPAALNFVTAVYKTLMGEEPPWEKDGFHWSLLVEVIMGQFSRVFFIGVFAQTSLNALFSREYPRGSQILPVEGVLGMAASICFTAHDVAVMDAEKIRKDIERLLKSTAPTRIPYNIYRRLTGDADVDRKLKKGTSR